MFISSTPALAQDPAPDETLLGEFLIVGDDEDVRPTLAILPSWSAEYEDVVARGVVRRDFELSGMFRMIADQKAPATGSYGFDDPVDVQAWRNVGAQIAVKIAVRKVENSDKFQVIGLAYVLASGSKPVFREVLTVTKDKVRVTSHRITDSLLEALTGRRGGFASHMTFANRSKAPQVFTVDADGHGLLPVTAAGPTTLAPVWGPQGGLFYVESRNYSPFRLAAVAPTKAPVLQFPGSVYSVAFSADGKKMAVSVDENGGSSIYVGNPDGTGMKRVSNTLVSVRPVFSPSGKLAWVGGAADNGTQRIYVDGKPVSPSGFSAAGPTFCDTEDGIRLVFSVSIGGGRSDLVWTTETGKGISRLTQNSGSNTGAACSPDGRLLAYFSERKQESGLYVKSLKSFTSQKITNFLGSSLNWAALPPETNASAGK